LRPDLTDEQLEHAWGRLSRADRARGLPQRERDGAGMNALSKQEIAALREGDIVYVRMVVASRSANSGRSMPNTQRGDLEIALRAGFSGTHRWERRERSRAQRDRVVRRCPLHSESAIVAAQQRNSAMCQKRPVTAVAKRKAFARARFQRPGF